MDIRDITGIIPVAITVITVGLRIIVLTTIAGGRTTTAATGFTDTTSIIIDIIKERLV